ncbi:MAG: hypothetical protein HOO91_08325 [Bacteroidales bacterium]|nr:hypothetical protein [Bacteroidales bacterium]
MKNSNEFIQFTANLANAIMQSIHLSGVNGYAQLINKTITDIIPSLPTIKKELASKSKIKKKEWIAAVQAMNIKGINPSLAVKQGLLTCNILLKKSTKNAQDDLAKAIQFVCYYVLILIEDLKKDRTFFSTKIQYKLSNPQKDFWFQRIDMIGTHEFNTPDGNYLINSIPAADKENYYNSEIYNSPYTSEPPLNVIVNPYPVEEITDSIELKNFIFDLFLNNPFASSQNLVFSAKIKAENLIGGSRGWGFWNTDAIPIIGMKIAWFMQQNDGNINNPNNGFFAHTFNGAKFSAIKLKDMDENWHAYKIVLNQQKVEYFIDGLSVAIITDPENIPDAPMAFHNWVDNACFVITDDGFKKVFQKTDSSRKNYMKNMNIFTLGK